MPKTIKIIILVLLISLLFTPALLKPETTFAATTCSARASQTTVNPGDTFIVDINWSDGKPHPFTYKFVGTNIQPVNVNNVPTSPYGLTLTAPDQFFSAVEIYWKTVVPAKTIFDCFAQVTNNAPPAPNQCAFDFNPKSLPGAGNFSVTVNNTRNRVRYTAHIGTNGETAEGNGSTVTIPMTAPDKKGNYNVTVSWYAGIGNTGECAPLNSNSLTVQSNSSSVGTNPCDISGCNTALGKIPINPQAFGGRILTIAIGLAGGTALIFMVIGSIRILTSSGDQQKLAGGRDQLVAALAGLLFLILSVLILRFIGTEVIGLK